VHRLTIVKRVEVTRREAEEVEKLWREETMEKWTVERNKTKSEFKYLYAWVCRSRLALVVAQCSWLSDPGCGGIKNGA